MSRSGIVRLATLALLWGSAFLWIKLGLRGFSAVQLVLIRLMLAIAVLTPIALARQMRFPTDRMIWVHLFVAALVGNVLPYTLFGLGEQTVGSNVAGVLNATTPLWTLLIAFVAGTDRRVTGWRGLGIALGFAGTILIFSPWESAGEIASWGGLACLGASACFGICFVYIGRFLSGRGIPAVVLSVGQLGAGIVLMLPILPFGGLAAPTWRADAVVALLVLGLGTGLAYVLNFRLIADVGPTAASTTTYLVPVVAVVLGALVVSEQVTVTMLAGMLLVLGGVALVQRSGRTTVQPTPHPAKIPA